MNNLYLSKVNVYFIDSPYIALVTSFLIKQDYNYTIVFEIKPYEREEENLHIMKMILGVHLKNYIVLKVPHPWNLIYRKNIFNTLKNLQSFKKHIDQLFKYSNKINYYGSITSSLMLCSPPNNRIYIDHGFGEPSRRIKYKFSIIKNIDLFRILAILLYKPLQIPAFDFEIKRLGYTACKLSTDYFKHINLEKYELTSELSTFLKEILNKIKPNCRVVLGLMSSEWHNENEFPIYDESFNLPNLNLIRNQCLTTDLIFVKFHRQLYVNGFNSNFFIEYCKKFGYSIIDVDKHLPINYRGLIPVELLIKILGIKKIFAEVSGALINVSHFEGVNVNMDFLNFWSLRSDSDKVLIHEFLQINDHLFKPININK